MDWKGSGLGTGPRSGVWLVAETHGSPGRGSFPMCAGCPAARGLLVPAARAPSCADFLEQAGLFVTKLREHLGVQPVCCFGQHLGHLPLDTLASVTAGPLQDKKASQEPKLLLRPRLESTEDLVPTKPFTCLPGRALKWVQSGT